MAWGEFVKGSHADLSRVTELRMNGAEGRVHPTAARDVIPSAASESSTRSADGSASGHTSRPSAQETDAAATRSKHVADEEPRANAERDVSSSATARRAALARLAASERAASILARVASLAAAGSSTADLVSVAASQGLALDRRHFIRMALQGDLRATYWVLQFPELMLGEDFARAGVAGFVPTPTLQDARHGLYLRLLGMAGTSSALAACELLSCIESDLRTGWLHMAAGLSVLQRVHLAHGDVELGRRAALLLATLFVNHGGGIERFDLPAAQLFAGLVNAPEPDIASAARNGLWRIQHLRVGQPVPDLCGNDPDGNELCIDDFRGRVLVVEFWSCQDTCYDDVLRRDNELVETFWDHPFALIGVNRDAERAEYIREREEVGFPGCQLYGGPLAEDLHEEVRQRRALRPALFDAWRETRPGAIYLIDSRGVIRAVNPQPARLAELVRALIDEHYLEARIQGF